MNARNLPGCIRLVLAGTIIVLAAYWAGARYGQHQPLSVEAVRPNATPHEPSPEPSRVSSSTSTDAAKPTAANLAQRDAILTDDEGINVKVYRAASPAVANILTKATEYDFFMDPVPVEGAGSGFVIDEKGYILTNFHVVQEAQSIEVVLGDQTRYPGKFIGADQRNDVALVKIDPKGKHLTALPLGDSTKLQVGQKVLDLGNPFGFQSTLTTGVVSALGRTVQTGETTFIDEAIQTDASINRGNSGGPLLDSHGQVIGINSAIYAPNGTTAGIGFAIPINTARRVAEDLIKYGRVRRATLGAEGRALWPGLAEALKLNVQQGILIERVEPGGAAAAAGIRGGNKSMAAGLQELRIGGDVLIAVDGKAITNQMDLNLMLNRSQPGNSVTLTIVRDGKQINIPVQLGEGSKL